MFVVFSDQEAAQRIVPIRSQEGGGGEKADEADGCGQSDGRNQRGE